MLQDNSPHESGDRTQSLALGIIALATLLALSLRLLPHLTEQAWLFNVGAVGALALFAGARLRSWLGLVAPLLALVASDVVLWFMVGWPPAGPVVYGSYLVYVLLGRLLIGRSRSPLRIGGVTLLGAAQFFLITNFAVFVRSAVDPATIPGGAAWYQVMQPGTSWALNKYAANAAGLVACYSLALPFAWRTVLSDLGFTALFFGLAALLSRAALARKPVVASPLRPVEKPS